MQLVLNAGSSSLKWALFQSPEAPSLLEEGNIERIANSPIHSYKGSTNPVEASDHKEALSFLLEFLRVEKLASNIDSVVHRVVHGGEYFHVPVIVDDDVKAKIASLSDIAPLHNPVNLSVIKAVEDLLPGTVNVAVFDTAFHHTISDEVFRYALPYELYEKFGIRKYGFHGSSHAFIARYLEGKYGDPVDAISCHLGAGSSVTALKKGRSADTTMGFTPLDGLVMSTRSGEIDPDIPLYLLRHGYSVDDVEELLTKRSGLQGLTGFPDLRDVWRESQAGNARCRLALEILSYSIAYFINAMKTTVREPRAIVFTGGIGINAWYVRERVFELLDIDFDEDANKRNLEVVAHDPDVFVIRTREELEMHLQSASLFSK